VPGIYRQDKIIGVMTYLSPHNLIINMWLSLINQLTDPVISKSSILLIFFKSHLFSNPNQAAGLEKLTKWGLE